MRFLPTHLLDLPPAHLQEPGQFLVANPLGQFFPHICLLPVGQDGGPPREPSSRALC